MPSRDLLLSLAFATLAIASLITATVSWTRLIQLSLPLPPGLPALNILFTIFSVIAGAVSRQLLSQAKKKVLMSLLPRASTFALVVLFTLSLVYTIPSDIESCAANCQWLRMFKNKNEIAIRTIQAKLRCCGYNSMHDRAWPFPSKDFDARTCEKTQGYYIACGGLWRQEQQFAAAMSAVASFLNWLLVVSFGVLAEW
jgi:hypothetical protein